MSTQTHTEKYSDFKAIEEHREGYHEPFDRKTTRRDDIVDKVNENFKANEEYWIIEFLESSWATPNDEWFRVLNTAMFCTEKEAEDAFDKWGTDEFCHAEWVDKVQVIHIKKGYKNYTWSYKAEEEEETTEFEVEYGYMIDEETHGETWTTCFKGSEKEAKEYYDMLVSNNEYDYVWLVMRHMEGEDCVCSETIEEYNPEGHKKKNFNVEGRDWVWCCGNKIPKHMEAVGCSVCF